MDQRTLARMIRTIEAAADYTATDDDRFAAGYTAGLRAAATWLRQEQEDAAA